MRVSRARRAVVWPRVLGLATWRRCEASLRLGTVRADGRRAAYIRHSARALLPGSPRRARRQRALEHDVAFHSAAF